MTTKKPKIDEATLTVRVIKIDDFRAFLGFMPNPDEVLRDAGKSIETYRLMKADARIKSLLRVAKAEILNYPLSLEQGKAEDSVYEGVKEGLDEAFLYEAEKRLLTAMDYGYSCVELLWKNDAGLWKPVDAVQRKPERFVFDMEGRLKHRSMSGLVDLYTQAYKWLVYRFDKDAENHYGTSALKACYWPWAFKKAGAEFWLMAAEKFAVPSILALFESSKREEDIREKALELSEMLSSIQSGSGGAVAIVP
jgi:hypothetical protein